ncbi:uncharacterized protein LOC103707332 isoform X2 [Phoenix dactylifera]|uniref:Uncharacterized protein LOC103707332 isoform X2 n=1 Tax=Phoenix dactylifera TaxID=42345 RepID=A0A8B7C206_PHODC|nr:uncharacterized protein LOC103707332 isoform X2 [Phoenix dactylifera]
MASDETMTAVHEFVDDDDDDFMPDGDGDDDVDDDIVYRRMSRLSIEISDGDDADAELSSEKEESRKSLLASLMEEDNFEKDSASTVWTPLRGQPCRAAAKEYASEVEARERRGRGDGGRERWLKRAWEMKKRAAAMEGLDGGAGGGGVCRVLVRPRGGVGAMCMDMEEVKACRDLGLELPCDWTVEISCGHSGSTVDTSSGDNSPVASWRISSAGDDPENVKARLKVWAQAVALASAVDSLL